MASRKDTVGNMAIHVSKDVSKDFLSSAVDCQQKRTHYLITVLQDNLWEFFFKFNIFLLMPKTALFYICHGAQSVRQICVPLTLSYL